MRKKLWKSEDAGFSLVEVVVALFIFAFAAQALLTLLIISARDNVAAKDYATAKNLATAQFEFMNSLPFTVSNVPGTSAATDILNLYYPNVTPAASATTAGYVAASSSARGAAEPAAGAFYRVVQPALPTPNSKYAMNVATQFLTTGATSTSSVAVAPQVTYDTHLAGSDQPPSLQLGVTIVLNWTANGSAKSFRLYSQIASTNQTSHGKSAAVASSQLVSSQVQAEAVRLSTSVNGDENFLSLGAADANGNAGTSVSASGDASGGTIRSSALGTADVFGASNHVGAPPDATTAMAVMGPISTTGDSTCAYSCVGGTQSDGQAASVAGGLPTIHANGLPNSGVAGRVLRQGCVSGCTRASKGFSAGNSTSLANQPTYSLSNGLFYLSDGSSGSDDAAGTAQVSTTGGSGHAVTGIATAMTQRVDAVPTTFTPAGNGLIYTTLTSASLTCTASASGGTASATYAGTVSYYGKLTSGYGYTTISFNYANGSMAYGNGSGLPPLSSIQVTNKSHLSDYFTDWGLGPSPQISTDLATNAVTAAVPFVFHLTTQPTNTSDPTSQWTLNLGGLSCAAHDAR